MYSEFTIRIPATELKDQFERVLRHYGFPDDQAIKCAGIFLSNSLDGVYSHGVTRFPKFVRHVREGHIHPGKQAICKAAAGNLEQWDGQLGPGPVNATLCTARAVSLAKSSGIGCVALANTNHWLRGGQYGWQAAREGCVFIGWSNTIANMPAWGAVDARLGNNPLVMAIPYHDEAIVLDMAVSQYSYGALEMHELKKELLPVPGGYDLNGKLTVNPGEIRQSQRALPAGYWKGSGLSLLLDILAAVLSGGKSTREITSQGGEYNLSQVFIAIDLSQMSFNNAIAAALDRIIEDYHSSIPEKQGVMVRYPGEKIVKTREENNALGVPVLKTIWEEIGAL